MTPATGIHFGAGCESINQLKVTGRINDARAEIVVKATPLRHVDWSIVMNPIMNNPPCKQDRTIDNGGKEYDSIA